MWALAHVHAQSRLALHTRLPSGILQVRFKHSKPRPVRPFTACRYRKHPDDTQDDAKAMAALKEAQESARKTSKANAESPPESQEVTRESVKKYFAVLREREKQTKRSMPEIEVLE